MAEVSGDNFSIFINLVTKSIENAAGLTTKVDNIADTQKRQDIKLDGLLTTMAEVRALNGNLDQRLNSAEKDLIDHETRIRVMEPKVNTLYETDRKRLENIELTIRVQQETTEKIKLEMTRYIAIAGTVLLVLQTVFTLFLVPWIQKVLFGG